MPTNARSSWSTMTPSGARSSESSPRSRLHRSAVTSSAVERRASIAGDFGRANEGSPFPSTVVSAAGYNNPESAEGDARGLRIRKRANGVRLALWGRVRRCKLRCPPRPHTPPALGRAQHVFGELLGASRRVGVRTRERLQQHSVDQQQELVGGVLGSG